MTAFNTKFFEFDFFFLTETARTITKTILISITLVVIIEGIKKSSSKINTLRGGYPTTPMDEKDHIHQSQVVPPEQKCAVGERLRYWHKLLQLMEISKFYLLLRFFCTFQFIIDLIVYKDCSTVQQSIINKINRNIEI